MESQNYEPCLVCGGQAKGCHFQVTSCRACSSFYQRSIKLKLKYRCQKGINNCDLVSRKSSGKPLCRYCRFQKCKDVGMTLANEEIPDVEENIALARLSETRPTPRLLETIDITLSVKFPEDFDAEIRAPFSPSIPRMEGIRLIYNCDPLINAIKFILNKPYKPIYELENIKLTFMQQLKCAFDKNQEIMRPNLEDSVIETLSCVDLSMFKFYEVYITNMAIMLMKCEHFAKLPFDDKYKMFVRFWKLFAIVERTFATTKVFGSSIKDNRFLVSNNFAVKSEDQWSLSGFTPDALEKLKPYMYSLAENYTKFVFQPLKSMRINEYEVVYLAAYILWSSNGLHGLSDQTYQISEDLFDQCTKELHNYYVYDMNMPNYGPRLAKFGKIIATAEQIWTTRKNYITLAKIFNLFDCDFCNSDLMEVAHDL